MKKTVFACLAVLAMLLSTTMVVWGDVEYVDDIEKDSHKVRNKWDLSGSFVAHPGYNWGGLAEGATWAYSIHIKEAMNGDYSVGSIHFWTDGVDVVGRVKATQRWYDYWSGDNIAAVGDVTYNDTPYNFMFLYAERAVWFAISQTPYDTYWEAESVWPSSLRAYQLHSKVPDETFLLDYKVIHE